MSIRKDMLAESIGSALGISTNVLENTTIASLYDAQNDQFFTVVMPVSFDLAEKYMEEHYFDANEPTGVFEGTPQSFEITLAGLKTINTIINELTDSIIEAEELHEEIALSRFDPYAQ